MHRVIQILSVSLLLTLASAANGQTPSTCGIVDIDGPSEVEPGTPLALKVKVTSIHTTKPEFKWNVSVGTIVGGQGTEQITVDTVGLGGQDLTVTVELSGVPLGCKGSASKTTKVKSQPMVCGLAFDQYGDISFEDEEARLDNFAIQLANQPLTGAQILASAGQESYEGEAAERLARAKSYLVDVREIDPGRIVTVECGFSKHLNVQLIVVPVGAAFVACSNSGEAGYPEVKFTKPRPKPSKKPR
jgi:hypothetical protein